MEFLSLNRLESILETRDMGLYDDHAVYDYADFEEEMSENEWLANDHVKKYLESVGKEYE